MIMSNVRNNVNLLGRFRLLNSEIGNDQMNIKTIETIFTRFRLLNSEIGNDQAD